MAHAALVYLMQLLDGEVIQFSCRVLEIEEEKARLFHVQANKVLNKLSKFKFLKDVPIFHLMQLKEGLKHLVLPNNDDLMDAARSPDALLDSRWILNVLPNIHYQIYHLDCHLRGFRHRLNGEVINHSAPTLTQQQALANDLLAANEEFRKIIEFFGRLISEAQSHYSRAGRLLRKLKDCNHDVVNHVKIAAEEAAESIEDFLTVAGRYWFERKDFIEDKGIHDLSKNVKQLLDKAWENVKFNSITEEKQKGNASGDLAPNSAVDLLQFGSSKSSKIKGLRKDESPEKGKKEEEKKAADLKGASSRTSRHGKDESPRKQKKEEKKAADLQSGSSQSLQIKSHNKYESPKKVKEKKEELKRDEMKDEKALLYPAEDLFFAPLDFQWGLDNEMGQMIDELTERSSGLKILNISEISGTGKSSLAEKVFRDQTVARNFGCRLLVQSISIDQVLSNLLHSLAPFRGEIENLSMEDKGKLLHKSLKKSKYLVVLHGLQNLDIWEAIQNYFPDDEVGSRIILSIVLNPERLRTSSSLEHGDILVSLDEDTSTIIDELTRPPYRLSIVTIAGMGGIGKTTLAKKVFSHPNIVHHFHYLAWISTVSNIDQVLSHILHTIAPHHDGIQGQSIEDKGELLRKSLKGSKYLIVVDGLWNFDVWNAVQAYFPDDEVGSRIFVTTRVVEFPSTKIHKNPPHCMSPLDRHRSFELLEKLVFGRESCPGELVSVGKQIAERCGGLPLAIVIIAGILNGIPRSSSSWQSIKFAVTSIVSADAERCLDILSLSYSFLPHYLKACFLYMGAFPANCQIEVKKLLNLWMANGFLDQKSSENEAEKYLKDLIDRSLVWVGKRSLNGKVKTCFIHDLVRQLCLREAQKENFMQIVESNAIANGLENQHHLIFALEHLDNFQLLPPLPNLHSFIWLNLASDFTPAMILLQLSAFKRLRVLDIYFVPFDTFPSQLLNLLNLRYLALNVSYELPASLSQLLKLQTLLIYGPWVSGKGDGTPTLYLEFWKMPWLRNVYVKVPICLKYPYPLHPLPDGLWGLGNLQILSKMAFSCCSKEVFLLMANLKKLGMCETKEDSENGELTKCFPNLSLLNELETLKCSFYKGNREPRCLDWGVLPVNLKELTLSGSHLSWDEMKFLALLPRLETLKLKNYAFQGQQWVVAEEEVFETLKHLLIDNTDLVNWEVETTDNFPRLRCLVLRSCKFLEKIPCAVGELSVLMVIELHHCSESAKISAREFEEQYGFPKVVTGSY